MAEKTATPFFRAPFVRRRTKPLSGRILLLVAVVLTSLCFVVIGRIAKALFRHPSQIQTINAINVAGAAEWEGWDKLDNLFVL